jgi:hypothetical protein
VSKSFAAAMFARHPRAELVIVQFQRLVLDETGDFATMAEHRAGKRPQWTTFAQIPYERKPQPERLP